MVIFTTCTGNYIIIYYLAIQQPPLLNLLIKGQHCALTFQRFLQTYFKAKNVPKNLMCEIFTQKTKISVEL